MNDVEAALSGAQCVSGSPLRARRARPSTFLSPLADATALRAVTAQEVGRVTNAPCLLDLPYLEQVNVGDTDDVSAELSARLDRHTSENLQRNRTSAPPIQG